jgi:hypothetical protein
MGCKIDDKMLALSRENKLAFYNRQIRNSKHAILQYDSVMGGLRTWKWCVGLR